jgi:hypothetical protein
MAEGFVNPTLKDEDILREDTFSRQHEIIGATESRPSLGYDNRKILCG